MSQKKYRLLIADDEESILNSMKHYIGTHSDNFEKIYCARNGQEALDLIVRHRPDVMILDVRMPVKNGLEVMKEAREMEFCPKTIILSGYDTFSFAQQALRMGAVDYLLKPASSREILEVLDKTLGQTEKQASEETNPMISRAIEYMKAHMREDLSLSRVAGEVNISATYLSTLFTQNTGMGFVDYLNQIRIEAACGYMHDERKKVYEIAFLVGFHDEKYFSRVFRKQTGMTPSEYRKEIAGKKREVDRNDQ